METKLARTPQEVSRAHDLLTFIILSDLEKGTWPEPLLEHAVGLLSVLCWVLGHDHADEFTVLLKQIEAALEKVGGYFDETTRTFVLPEQVI